MLNNQSFESCELQYLYQLDDTRLKKSAPNSMQIEAHNFIYKGAIPNCHGKEIF